MDHIFFFLGGGGVSEGVVGQCFLSKYVSFICSACICACVYLVVLFVCFICSISFCVFVVLFTPFSLHFLLFSCTKMSSWRLHNFPCPPPPPPSKIHVLWSIHVSNVRHKNKELQDCQSKLQCKTAAQCNTNCTAVEFNRLHVRVY